MGGIGFRCVRLIVLVCSLLTSNLLFAAEEISLQPDKLMILQLVREYKLPDLETYFDGLYAH